MEFEQDPLPTIDERWLSEYAEMGITKLVNVLKVHADFRKWCEENDRDE